MSEGEIVAGLRRLGLWSGPGAPSMTALAGGVSSDIWRVDLPDGPVCVKRALARLKVAAEWRAPVGRNAFEWAYMERVGRIVPGFVPRLVARDEAAGLFVMAWLPPERYRLWKTMLREGEAEPAHAAALGRAVAAVHAATAGRAEIARAFPTGEAFHALRIEPYLLATAARHPELTGALVALAGITASQRKVLVHGDVSPKNILIGPDGPVLLDAECAWYGEPAFDPAFCLNHLLLKCLWNRAAAPRFLACFAALAEQYLAGADWEEPGALERRIARLLPGLLLARVDGKSPVEYVTAEADKALVRHVARALLRAPPDRLAAVAAAWRAALLAHGIAA
ncbi:MAG: phosphotransferase [Alphaproteobacteria bacterium]|nr:phosphotransferase [Alphaproteobacteria bacterium]